MNEAMHDRCNVDRCMGPRGRNRALSEKSDPFAFFPPWGAYQVVEELLCIWTGSDLAGDFSDRKSHNGGYMQHKGARLIALDPRIRLKSSTSGWLSCPTKFGLGS